VALSEAGLRQLIERIDGGDRAAADALIGGMRDRIVRWALVITGDVDDAEDVAQRVSITLHQRLGGFEGRARFTTWLYTVVRNAALDVRGRSRGHATVDEDELAALPAATEDRLARVHDDRLASLIRGFFSELPPRQRQLIELVDQEGQTAAEAAHALGIKPETARVHLMRARRALRRIMLDRHPEMFE